VDRQEDHEDAREEGGRMKLIAKNWDEFQHYKDRSPAWIKLHRHLLDNYEYQSLPVASRALAPMLWLIASESADGSIDAQPAKLAFRLRMTVSEVTEALTPLISNGFFICVDGLEQLASDTLAPCLPREEKRESREEEEKEEKPVRKRNEPTPPVEKPNGVDDQVWADWLSLRKKKKADVSQTVLQSACGEAAKLGWTLNDFLKEWCLRGSQGLKAEWVQNSAGRTGPPNGRPKTFHDISQMDYTKGVREDGSF
jgi:hypothetical protein